MIKAQIAAGADENIAMKGAIQFFCASAVQNLGVAGVFVSAKAAVLKSQMEGMMKGFFSYFYP